MYDCNRYIVMLKMSPNSAWHSEGSLYRRSDLGLVYDILMAAGVVAGIVN